MAVDGTIWFDCLIFVVNFRVRHHTLNESMKAICSRVPGYDPNAKETKVVVCFVVETANRYYRTLDKRN